MSARKVESSSIFPSVSVQARETRLSLPPDQVRIHRNGVEFRSDSAITPWTEMTVTLQSTQDSGRVHCTGVVVACNGNRHDGYAVSMVFTSLSKQSRARLESLAYS
jgi:PilZ domain